MCLEKRPGHAYARQRKPEPRSAARLSSPLPQLRLATPYQLKALLPQHQDTDCVHALRNLRADALVGRTHRAQQSCWYCTAVGLAEAAASGELPPKAGRTTGQRAAAKTGLRERASPWSTRLSPSTTRERPTTPTGNSSSPTDPGRLPGPRRRGAPGRRLQRVRGERPHPVLRRLVAKLERYDAHPQRTGERARQRRPRPAQPLQEIYAGTSLERPFPPLLFVFAPARRRAAPVTREAAFHDRAHPDWRITMAPRPCRC